jgi:hypothetical protein
MQLIHSAEARELVIELDLSYDLQIAGELLDTYGNFEDLTDDEIERREVENERRVDLFINAYLMTLRQIGAEQHLTIYLGDVSEVTRTPVDPEGDDDTDTWERRVWQEAHDRTPAGSLWQDSEVQA